MWDLTKTFIQAYLAEARDGIATDSLLMLKLMAQSEADIPAERTTVPDRVFANIQTRLTTAAGD